MRKATVAACDGRQRLLMRCTALQAMAGRQQTTLPSRPTQRREQPLCTLRSERLTCWPRRRLPTQLICCKGG